MLYDNLSVNEFGHLTIGGVDTVELAEAYGTPLYVLDEARLRDNIRMYQDAMAASFGTDARPLYASKSLAFKEIYRILDREGMHADVVSAGELYTALQAGFPAANLYYHGNYKTTEELRFALEAGIGCVIVDHPTELEILDQEACALGRKQAVLLRVTPGIDNHTLKAINTGRVDNQFGVPIGTGQALPFVKQALACEHLEVRGFHSHIGSQIFGAEPFVRAVDILMEFAAEVRSETGFLASVLNLGGGFAVRYLDTDPEVDIPGNIAAIAEHLRNACEHYQYPLPQVLMEPGRSLVADCGLTLYTTGVIKEIRGHRSYAIVDGGMADNPRYALYESPYTIYCASRMHDQADTTVTIAGRACESGDLIQEHVQLPSLQPGDLLAVLGTGAYNYSMASNYNRFLRPAVVLVADGTHRLGVRRQTMDDLLAQDL